jgi:hypothetical protein
MTTALGGAATILVAVISVAACGGGRAEKMSPWPSPPPGGIVLTWNDDRQSRQAALGQEIDVRLTAAPCSATSTPTADNQAILASLRTGAAGGYSWAQFRAIGVGSTDIAAVNKMTCKSHPGVRGPPNRGFVVTVVVR